MEISDLFNLIGAKCGIISIDTPSIEERNILHTIASEAEEKKYEVLFWSYGNPVRQVLLCEAENEEDVRGIMLSNESLFMPQNAFTPASEACAVLSWFQAMHRKKEEIVRSIIILADVHKIASDLPQDSVLNRRIKDIAIDIESSATFKRIVLMGSGIILAPSLSNLVEEIKIGLPEGKQIKERLEYLLAQAQEQWTATNSMSHEEFSLFIRASQGLTLQEIDRNFRIAMKTYGRDINNNFIDFMQRRKVEKFAKLGVEFSPAPDVAIAGLDLWQLWVKNNSRFFEEDARRLGIAPPKGAALVGIPGTGKSLAAKSIAAQWKIPVLSLNIGSALSSYVGESESRFRQILAMSEAVSPCVLYVDEIDKAFAGVGAGALDSGVMDRIFGDFLSWMNDKKSPVFVIAAANRIQGLPPELFRKGRFDEVFFVDLPNLNERRAILDVHCANRKVEVEELTLNEIASRTEKYNGSEIASLVTEAQKLAYLRDSSVEVLVLTLPDFLTPLQDIKPISQTRADDIKKMVEWGMENARPASSSGMTKKASTRSRRGSMGGGMDI